MHRGYVKLWRKMEEWEWYQDSFTFHLFMHMLLKANHKDSAYRGVPVPRGSCIVGFRALSKQTGMSVQNVRTAMAHLQRTGDVTLKSTHHFSLVCIGNYESYQQKPTHAQHTPNTRLTRSKECKNVRMKDKSRGFSSQDTTDLKAVVAQVMGWGEESEATEIESKRIIHKIETSKRMINRPIAYAIGMAKKLSDHQT